jgi:TRAP-type mannitol/chloroaromatic compound transport system permease small subunit
VFIERLDRLNRRIGEIVSWLVVAMVLVTFVVVVLRYALDTGWIWVQETITWMHASVFMLGAAYTLASDEHVRVDVFYRDMKPAGRAIVNLAGTILFLLPVSVFILLTSVEYASVSWSIGETSREAGGLPYPWPSLLKSVVPLTATLLVLQGVVIATRAALTLAVREGDKDDASDEEHRWPG